MKKRVLALFIFLIITSFSLLLFFFDITGISGFIIYNGAILEDTCKNPLIDNSFVLNEASLAYLKFNNLEDSGERSEVTCDFSGNSRAGFIYQALWQEFGGPFQDGSFEFFGNEEIIIRDDDVFSPSTTGEFSVSFWIQPSTFNFVGTSKDLNCECAIHPISKYSTANGGQREWYFRLYNDTGFDGGVSRSKRFSFYVFSQDNGLGAGSYFQDDLQENEWIHIVGIFNGTHTFIYKNSLLRDEDPVDEYNITMGNGDANVVLGKIPGGGGFQGSFDELRFFDRVLSEDEIVSLYEHIPLDEPVIDEGGEPKSNKGKGNTLKNISKGSSNNKGKGNSK